MSASTGPSPLCTDLYELTMTAGYWELGMAGAATFSLFLRRQPQRGYYVAGGLAAVLDMLEGFQFHDDDIAYLKQLGLFQPGFLDYLRGLRFTGDVWALPEGSIFFPDEPILEVTAPLIEAQLLETLLINTIGLHTLTATKASRCVYAAKGRKLVDFALRRTQGVDAGMAVSRSTYLAGFDATSNLLAGKKYGIPVAGTMAHSFVQSFPSEREAFEAYADIFPDRTILLIDTYDTIRGAQLAVQIAHDMASSGKQLAGVRLDSGDIIALSRQVRRIFDAAGLPQVDILASGGLDEYSVAEIVARDAPIDAFGVGTRVGVSADRPYLNLVYKLVQYENRNVRKLSHGKKTLAAPKQLFRYREVDGMYKNDIIGLRSETMHLGQQLLDLVMERGRICQTLPALEQIRHRFKSRLERLPEPYKQLNEPLHYPVGVSRELMAEQAGEGIVKAC